MRIGRLHSPLRIYGELSGVQSYFFPSLSLGNLFFHIILVQVLDVVLSDACLRCQGESKKDSYGKQDCVVVWGECNHSFHFCCMSLWVKQNNRCPLCQQEWSIQRMGK
ncbi:jg11481 [Pararge aegeria aegeria]|uniref:Jg11481 protein n=1 Tax=Pararge aegeria aegeria TaxID=348720 RepID=A0A8S4RPC2_9NEOP|nr:jg11481 [Pararge aegeria aegeria]